MKRLMLLPILIIGLNSFAAVITCSNNPNSPGQYTSLQDAVDNSNANDTILVQGSSTNYADPVALSIKSHPVTIIGQGYNNPNGDFQKAWVGQIYITHSAPSISGNGTKLIGLEITQVLFGSHNGGASTSSSVTVEDITIERCKFNNISGGIYNASLLFGWNSSGPRTFDNIKIRNCYFSGLGVSFRAEGGFFNLVKFENCVFDKTGTFLSVSDTDLSSVIVENCLFSNYTGSLFGLATGVLPNISLKNNIFYKANPSGCSDCVFDNNLTYLCSDDNLIYSGNPGSSGGGNIIGQDPLFTNFPIAATSFDYTYDLKLLPGSPALGAGVSGTDVGVYGGVSPFTDAADVGANPAIPQMQEITTPLGSTVSKGTNLNVNFKSYKQD